MFNSMLDDAREGEFLREYGVGVARVLRIIAKRKAEQAKARTLRGEESSLGRPVIADRESAKGSQQ